MKLKNYYLSVFFIGTTILLTSCKKTNDASNLISNLESCLGKVKTIEDSKQLSKNNAIEIANCMLPHMENLKTKLDDLNKTEQKEYVQVYEAEVEKSDYKEILKELNYNKVKKLVDLNKTESSKVSNENNTDWDEVLDSYSRYTRKFVRMSKKAQKGDASALEEYPSLLNEAEKLQSSLSKAQENNTLTDSQIRKMMRIQKKMLKGMEMK